MSSRAIKYASRNGVPLDSNLTTGGGTDATALINAILATNPATFVLDGPALLTGTLKVFSDTSIVIPSGCGLFLQANANCPMLMNGNPVRSSGGVPSGITDQNIRIIGGIFNGNGANQAYFAGTGSTYQWTVGIAFYGVNNAMCEGVQVIGSRTFAFHLANADTVRYYGCKVTNDTATIYTDALHVNDGVRNLFVDDLVGATGDDLLALCALDGLPLNSNTPLSPYVNAAGGNITDVDVRGLMAVNALSLLRIGTGVGARLDRAKIDGLKGTAQIYAGIINAIDPATTVGSLGKVVISDIAVTVNDDAVTNGYFNLGASFEDLTIAGFKRTGSATDLRPIVAVTTSASGNLTLSDFSAVEKGTQNSATCQLYIQGALNTLRLNGGSWVGVANKLFPTGAAFLRHANGGTVKTLIADDIAGPSLVDNATNCSFIGGATFGQIIHRSSFNNANNTDINNLTPEVGHPWTATAASFKIASNSTVTGTTAVVSVMRSSDATYALLDIGTCNNFSIEGAFTASANAAQFWIKIDSASQQSGILVDMLTTGVLIGQTVGGVFSSLNTLSATITAAIRHTYRITLVRDVVSVWVDGVSLGSVTVTDVTALTQTKLALNAASGATVDWGEIVIRRNN